MNKVAIYVRLSKEDKDKLNDGDDSESISNQINMLKEYCDKQDWSVYHIFNDEDFSGSDRARPDFNRMIDEAQQHKFDIVLCKTQSRFARDMEIVERYINTLFPIWRIRFVSVVDHCDTFDNRNRKARQINSLVDQWYLEDLSENIKATLAVKRRQGLWIGAFTPFGYVKDPKNKNHLVVDPEAAEIVKHIFDLYLQGYGVHTVTKMINKEGLLSPSEYKLSKGISIGMKQSNRNGGWRDTNVRRLLKNQAYVGDTVQGKFGRISYKTQKNFLKPKDEWIIVKDTHEAIIPRKIFEKVQAIMEQHAAQGIRCDGNGEISPFAGKLYCLNCGDCLRSHYMNNHQKTYMCRTREAGSSKCVGVCIQMNTLSKYVLEEIRKLYDTLLDETRIADKLVIEKRENKSSLLKKQLSNYEDELKKVEGRYKSLYYDKVDGIISADDYITFRDDLLQRREDLTLKISSFRTELEKVEQENELIVDKLEFVKRYKNIQELDRETVDALIERIDIGGSKYNRIINIYWKF